MRLAPKLQKASLWSFVRPIPNQGYALALSVARTRTPRHRRSARQILAHREEGIALKEQAVLVRAAHHSNLLELELGSRRIPYVKYGGLRFVEAAHVKDLLAAFRLADNASDILAWFRILQLLDGVGPATARRAIAALGVTDSDGRSAESGRSSGEMAWRGPVASRFFSRLQADMLAARSPLVTMKAYLRMLNGCVSQ